MEVASSTQHDSAAPLPLVAADLLSATVTALGERLHANAAWERTFGLDALWARLPEEDARFAAEYVAEAARGHLVSHQVFLVEPEEDGAMPSPVLLHFHPVCLPEANAGDYPVLISGEVLREPVSWALEQTRRRRMEVVGRMTMGVAHDFNNLLTTVLGHSELLSNELGDSPGASGESLKAIRRAAKDGAALVKKIQAYLRHEKRERFESVDCAALVAEVTSAPSARRLSIFAWLCLSVVVKMHE